MSTAERFHERDRGREADYDRFLDEQLEVAYFEAKSDEATLPRVLRCWLCHRPDTECVCESEAERQSNRLAGRG